MSNFSYKLEWVCECGWNAVIEDGLSKGTCKVLCSQKTWTDWGPGCEFLVEAKCPKCGRIFQYYDGYP